jgi:hypothetical protein
LNIDAESHEAAAMLTSLGRLAALRASDHANRESLNGNREQAAYWRRVMALIIGAALCRSIQRQFPAEPMPSSERIAA